MVRLADGDVATCLVQAHALRTREPETKPENSRICTYF